MGSNHAFLIFLIFLLNIIFPMTQMISIDSSRVCTSIGVIHITAHHFFLTCAENRFFKNGPCGNIFLEHNSHIERD